MSQIFWDAIWASDSNILLTQKGLPSFQALFSLIDANDGFGSVIMKVNTFDVSLV
jgi:hypothetical protein